MSTKTRKYFLSGTTNELADGQTRNITLVALLTTTEVFLDTAEHGYQVQGKRKTITAVYESKLQYVQSTLSFGLAVLSPTDIALQAQLDAKYQEDLEAYNKAITTDPKAKLKRPTQKVIVAEERGQVIAEGKASKDKSALATITTRDAFFTTSMIKGMLAEKFKQIQAEPDRFIRIAANMKKADAITPSEKVINSVMATPQVEQPAKGSSTTYA